MSARELPAREQAKAHIAGLFGILGRPFDEFRPVWSGLAHGPRRTLLILADMPQVWANRAYDDLSPQTVIELKTRITQLRDWLNKMLPADAEGYAAKYVAKGGYDA